MAGDCFIAIEVFNVQQNEWKYVTILEDVGCAQWNELVNLAKKQGEQFDWESTSHQVYDSINMIAHGYIYCYNIGRGYRMILYTE